jgi:hypothetical protein
MRVALGTARALWIAGRRVEAIYSSFRGGWIAKLRAAATPELLTVDGAAEDSLRALDLVGAIPPFRSSEPVPVNILESIDPPDSRWHMSRDGPFFTLAKPLRAFLDAVTITRIRAPFDYEVIDSWRL